MYVVLYISLSCIGDSVPLFGDGLLLGSRGGGAGGLVLIVRLKRVG